MLNGMDDSWEVFYISRRNNNWVKPAQSDSDWPGASSSYIGDLPLQSINSQNIAIFGGISSAILYDGIWGAARFWLKPDFKITPETYNEICSQWSYVNTSKPGQHGRQFADDIFKCIFFNENWCILIEISLKYARKGPIGNDPALVQIMAWRRTGDKPLSEPMVVSLYTDMDQSASMS